ncbi:MAG: S8 family serine peptidase, partial [Clostridia bacterium]|nr:S8 family serine peptidase [Clostridia bacterium]
MDYEMQENSSVTNTDTKIVLSDDDDVWVTVVLGEGAVTEYLQNPTGTIAEYLLTAEGEELVSAMQKQQEDTIYQLLAREVDMTVKHSYTTLVNGFSAYIKYGDIKKIEKLSQVKSVKVAEQYETPTMTSSEISAMFGYSGMFANETDYDGSNTIIAVIDTGLDYEHSAFATMPEQQLLSKEFIQSVLTKTNAYTKSGESITVDNVYISGKVPFGFDYCDVDTDVMPGIDMVMNYNGTHGTHVAGIAAGNDGTIKGAAYNAQLAIMKVFGDQGTGAYDTDICAALEDCLVLGVDIANLSLGRACGFAYERDPDMQYINELYDLAGQVGLTLNIATGNDGRRNYYSDTLDSIDEPENPDTGVVSAPSSYNSSFAVGSIENMIGIYFTANGNRINGLNSGNENVTYNFFDVLGDKQSADFEYVMIPNIGAAEDYAGIDVNGKIAIVSRGSISFEEKQQNAYNNGAIACLIYNNESGINIKYYSIRAQIVNLAIPTATITMEGGRLLKTQENKVITISRDNYFYEYSYYSSMGALADLSIGPDICGVGGNVYSAVPMYYDWFNGTSGYDYMSGTSMATPNVSSATAVVLQYLKETYPEKTAGELRVMLQQLVMSTAEIVFDADGLPVTPRQQGAGLIDLKAAIESDAILTVTGSDRAKINLGADVNKEGIYTLNFNLVNIGEEALTYDVSTMVFTESVWLNTYRSPSYYCIAQKAHMLDDSVIAISAKNATIVGNSVTVQAGATARIKIVVTLTQEAKDYMDETFANGIYVEGFIVLEGENQLNMPWMAFYGDWDNLPMFEPTTFDDEAPTWIGSDLYTMLWHEEKDADGSSTGWYTGSMYPAGTYSVYNIPDGYATPEPNSDAIAFNIGMDLETGEFAGTILDSVMIGAKRDMSCLHVEIVDVVTGEVISHDMFYNLGKFFIRNMLQLNFGMFIPEPLMFANNQKLKIKLYAEFNDKLVDEALEWDFVFDFEAPTLDKAAWRAEDGKTYLDLTVYDNNVLQATGLLTGTENAYTSLWRYMVPAYNFAAGKTNTYTIDMTDRMSGITNNVFAIELVDYAFNSVIYDIELPETLKVQANNLNNFSVDGLIGSGINQEFDFNRLNDFGSEYTYDTIYSNFGFDSNVVYDIMSDGNAEDFVIEDGVLMAYNGEGGDVVVPDGVISTAQYVFSKSTTITSITFPEGFTTLGSNSVSFLPNLTKLVFPSTLTTFTQQNIYACVSLSDMNLEDTNLSSVGYASLCGLKSLKEITFPDADKPLTVFHSLYVIYNLERIVFNGDVDNIDSSIMCVEGLKTVEFKGNLNSIAVDFWDLSFRVCDDLETVTFGGDVGRIGATETFVYGTQNSSTFAALPSLKKLEFFGNVGELQGQFVSSCTNLAEVIFHGNVGEIGSA